MLCRTLPWVRIAPRDTPSSSMVCTIVATSDRSRPSTPACHASALFRIEAGASPLQVDERDRAVAPPSVGMPSSAVGAMSPKRTCWRVVLHEQEPRTQPAGDLLDARIRLARVDRADHGAEGQRCEVGHHPFGPRASDDDNVIAGAYAALLQRQRRGADPIPQLGVGQADPSALILPAQCLTDRAPAHGRLQGSDDAPWLIGLWHRSRIAGVDRERVGGPGAARLGGGGHEALCRPANAEQRSPDGGFASTSSVSARLPASDTTRMTPSLAQGPSPLHDHGGHRHGDGVVQHVERQDRAVGSRQPGRL